MKHLVVLLVFLLVIPLLGVTTAWESPESVFISGSIDFDSVVSMAVELNATAESLSADGRNLSADYIRGIYASGGDDWKTLADSISKTGQKMFNSTLWSIRARANSRISVGIYGLNLSGGPLYLSMTGKGVLNISDEWEEEFLDLLMDSGAVINISAEPRENIELLIYPPPGCVINGESAYEWKGSADVFTVKKAKEMDINRAEILMDIYRLDTSGMYQNVFMNLSIDATLYWINIPSELRTKMPDNVWIKRASIALVDYSVEHSYLSEEDVKNGENSVINELEERIVRWFPGAHNISHEMVYGEGFVRFNILAEISAPVESFSSRSVLRWYASQKISIRLSGLDGFECNYTVAVPEGMKIMGISSRPAVPMFYTTLDGRSAFRALVSKPGEYTVSVTIGFLIDIDPLVPLIVLVVVSGILWMLVRKYVPERRGKRG